MLTSRDKSSKLAAVRRANAIHGARHLRERPRAVSARRYGRAANVVRAVLLEPSTERWRAALPPVVVWSVDDLALPALRHDLPVAGVPPRLPWLAASVAAAAASSAPAGPWAQQRARAAVVLGAFLARLKVPAHLSPVRLDQRIRSPRTWDAVWAAASPIARRRGVVTALQPDDFARALYAAHASD